MDSMRIGELAQQTGLSIETIRYYEREGLINKPRRSASGYRQFDEQDVRQIEFITQAKELGLTLSEIKKLQEMQGNPEYSSEDVKATIDAKIADMDAKISTWQEIRQTLIQLSHSCQDKTPIDQCPILQALKGQLPDPELPHDQSGDS